MWQLQGPVPRMAFIWGCLESALPRQRVVLLPSLRLGDLCQTVLPGQEVPVVADGESTSKLWAHNPELRELIQAQYACVSPSRPCLPSTLSL